MIEDLLCCGSTEIPSPLRHTLREALQPFVDRDLALIEHDILSITAEGLPYSRTIAAIFDAYRPQSARRFSSAV